MPCHVSKTEFAELVERAIAELPPQFARFMEEVAIEIQELASRKLLREMEIEDPNELFGVYFGTGMIERSVEDSGHLPDRILIFQRPHELACKTKRELVREIRITVLHEIGHFFGMDEDDLGKL